MAVMAGLPRTLTDPQAAHRAEGEEVQELVPLETVGTVTTGVWSCTGMMRGMLRLQPMAAEAEDLEDLLPQGTMATTRPVQQPWPEVALVAALWQGLPGMPRQLLGLAVEAVDMTALGTRPLATMESSS